MEIRKRVERRVAQFKLGIEVYMSVFDCAAEVADASVDALTKMVERVATAAAAIDAIDKELEQKDEQE